MLLAFWDCRISAYTSSRRKQETVSLPRLSSGWHEHIQAPIRSRQLLSERVTTRVHLAQISGPFQELGRATLGRTGDARRDEQRGVAIVLSPGVAAESLQFASPPRCASRRWRRHGPARSARCRAAHSGSARPSMASAPAPAVKRVGNAATRPACDAARPPENEGLTHVTLAGSREWRARR